MLIYRNNYFVILALVACLLSTLSLTTNAEVVPLNEVEITEAKTQGGTDPRVYPERGMQIYKMTFDTTNKDEPLTLGEATFERGIWLADSKIEWSYDLGGEYFSLSASIGSPNGDPETRSAVLEIQGDGETLYRSAPLVAGEVKPVMVDLRGVETLTFNSHLIAGKWGQLIVGNPVLTNAPDLSVLEREEREEESGNALPQPKIDAGPVEGRAPLTVNLNSDQSTDPDGNIMRYSWFFGDGGQDLLNFNTSHVYQAPGIYQVAVVAEDDKGGQGVARQFITVLPRDNMPPKPIARADAMLIKPGGKVAFDASDSFDPDGAIESHTWHLDDQEIGSGKTMTHTFSEMGIYNVKLAVTDNSGETRTTQQRVRVDDGSNSTVFPLREGSRIMFIGNSLLGALPELLAFYGRISEPPFEFTYGYAGKGGGKVEEYVNWDHLRVREKMREGWDIVVIQPWPRPYEEEWETSYKPYARTLVEWIRDAGAYPVFLEPHRDISRLPSQQPMGPERIGAFAKELGAGYIPAGQAWLKVYQDHPQETKNIKESKPEEIGGMLFGDGIHQDTTGQLLTTLVIWEYLTGVPATELDFPEGTWEGDAKFKRMEKSVRRDLIPSLQKVPAEVGNPAEPLQD